MVIVVQCSLEKPHAPSWDMSLVIPLFNHIYTINEFVDENDQLYTAADNMIHFTAEQNIDTVAVGNRLSLQDRKKSKTLTPPRLPEFIITIQDSITLTDHILVEEAVFRSGLLEIEIINHTHSGIDISIEFPSFTLDPDSGHFHYHTRLDPSFENQPSSSISSTNLEQAIFTPQIVNGKNQIFYNTIIKFDENITAENDVSVIISIKDIVFDHFRGRFGTFELPLRSQRYDMELPEELEGIKLGPTDGTLFLYNPIENVPVDISLSLRAIRDSATVAELCFDLTCENTGWNEIPLNNIESILNAYPDELDFSGMIKIGNSQDALTEINYSDSYYGRLLIDAGLAFELPAGYENSTSVDTLKIGKDFADVINQNLYRAAFVVNVENHLPIGAEMIFIFSDQRSDTSIYTESDSTDVIEHLVLKPAPVDTDNRPASVTQPETSILNFELTRTELLMFTNHTVYMGTRIKFPGTEGMVKVTTADYVDIKTRIEATFKTKTQD